MSKKMAQQKRMISLPEDISKELDKLIPSGERSDFIAESLAEGLQRLKREELINLLDDFEAVDGSGEDSVQTVRKIRQEETEKLINNS